MIMPPMAAPPPEIRSVMGLAAMMAFTVFLISSAYSRIIEHFPYGGGGYMVATRTLGPQFGVVSGCALLVDYVLTVSVSIASGEPLDDMVVAGTKNFITFVFPASTSTWLAPTILLGKPNECLELSTETMDNCKTSPSRTVKLLGENP